MSADQVQILIPRTWLAALTVARVVLAAGWLLKLWAGEQPAAVDVVVCLGAYLGFAVAGLFLEFTTRPGRVLLFLIADTVFFLVLANATAGDHPWLAVSIFALAAAKAAFLLQWREVVVLWSVCVSFLFLARPEGWADAAWAVLLTGAVALAAVLSRSRLQTRVQELSRQAVFYRTEAEKARESERLRIADDFHDGPLQNFMGLQIRLEVVRRWLEKDPRRAASELEQLQDFWRGQATELRAFLRSMRPIEVNGTELVASISRLVETFEKDTGIAATFTGRGSFEPPEPEQALEILQLVREALHNVRKHSGANRVAVLVERSNGDLDIRVEDNGTGFSFGGTYSLEELEMLRLGPASIKRRVRAVNGNLVLESRPGRGAGLRIRIPQ